MTKLPCEVIRDLLPLYDDDAASPASCRLVEEHLAGCPGCRQELEQLRRPLAIPADTDTSLLRRLRRRQRRSALLWGLAFVAVLFAVVLWPLLLTIQDQSQQYTAADLEITQTEDGRPLLQLSPRARGATMYAIYSADTDGETEIYLGFGHRTRALDWLYWVQGQLARVQSGEKLLGWGCPASVYQLEPMRADWDTDRLFDSRNSRLLPFSPTCRKMFVSSAYGSWQCVYYGIFPCTEGFVLDESVTRVWLQTLTVADVNAFAAEAAEQAGEQLGQIGSGRQHTVFLPVPDDPGDRVLLWEK